jgi:hypothetical protein
MTAWRHAETRDLYTPIALRLIDDFTAGAPIAKLGTALERQDGARWVETGVMPVRTLSGLLAYPGLGRAPNPAAAPTHRYRVRLTDDEQRLVYLPAYRFTIDGLEFDVAPWNDGQPPMVSLDRPEEVFLWPASNYPFPRAISVLRGRAIAAGGAPLRDVRITTGIDSVLSDARGAFSLPVRLTSLAPSVMITAEHARSGLAVSVNVPLPSGLANAIELQLV